VASVVAAHLVGVVKPDAEPGWTKFLVKKRVEDGQGNSMHLRFPGTDVMISKIFSPKKNRPKIGVFDSKQS
jgi:hypothetical protein